MVSRRLSAVTSLCCCFSGAGPVIGGTGRCNRSDSVYGNGGKKEQHDMTWFPLAAIFDFIALVRPPVSLSFTYQPRGNGRAGPNPSICTPPRCHDTRTVMCTPEHRKKFECICSSCVDSSICSSPPRFITEGRLPRYSSSIKGHVSLGLPL